MKRTPDSFDRRSPLVDRDLRSPFFVRDCKLHTRYAGNKKESVCLIDWIFCSCPRWMHDSNLLEFCNKSAPRLFLFAEPKTSLPSGASRSARGRLELGRVNTQEFVLVGEKRAFFQRCSGLRVKRIASCCCRRSPPPSSNQTDGTGSVSLACSFGRAGGRNVNFARASADFRTLAFISPDFQFKTVRWELGRRAGGCSFMNEANDSDLPLIAATRLCPGELLLAIRVRRGLSSGGSNSNQARCTTPVARARSLPTCRSVGTA